MKYFLLGICICVTLLSYGQSTSDKGDEKSLKLIRRYFFQEDNWLMPADSVSGVCFFPSKKEARKTVSFVQIPVMDKNGPTLTLNTRQDFVPGFILKNSRCVGLIKLNRTSKSYVAAFEEEIGALYKLYLMNKSCFHAEFSNKAVSFATDCN